MPEHPCDKALIVEQHGRDIANLFAEKNDLEGRLTEVEVTLYGAERNGGGFIKETKETLDLVRIGVNTVSEQMRELRDRKRSRGEVAAVVLPPLVTGAIALAIALLK